MHKKILIVDDSRISLHLLRAILLDDYEVLQAESGEEALNILNRYPDEISAVLLDIVMPGIDGYETLRRIRADARTTQIPVIISTEKRGGEVEVKSLALGANDFILKPYNPQVIRYRLRNIIGLVEAVGSAEKRRLEEAKVREASEQLKTLTESIPGGIAILQTSPKSVRALYYNDGFFSFSGYNADEYRSMSEKDPLCLVFPEDRNLIYEEIDKLAAGADEFSCSYRCMTKAGGYRWFDIKGLVSQRIGEVIIVNAVQFDITERKEAEESLRINEEQFRIAAATGDRIIARYDIHTKTYYRGEKSILNSNIGKVVENVPQAFLDDNLVAAESVADYLNLYDRINQGEKFSSYDIAFLIGNGEVRWFRCDATVIFDDNDQPSQAIIVYTDITKQREKETIYNKWQQSLRQKALESYTLFRSNLSKDTSLDSMEGELLKINFSEEATTFNSRTLEYAEEYVHPNDREKYIAALNADTLLANYYRDRRIETLEYREALHDGTIRWLRVTVELVQYPNSADVEAYLMYEDIDSIKTAQLMAEEKADNDPLTGILNRNAFARRIAELIADNSSSRHVLMMLDIDGFKLLNDTYGHAEGDQALIDITGSLRTVLRRGDLLGRLGGDEFVICFKDVPYDAVIDKKAKQICSLVHKVYTPDLLITTSIGIAVYPRDGEDFDTLYRNADEALYTVKNSGKNNFAYFSRESQENRLDLGDMDFATVSVSRRPTKRRMLIVDDSEVNRAILSKIFENDFLIETAKDGSSALVRMRRYGVGIGIVLLDLVMPGMDGFEVMEQMQSSVEMCSIPVIVVSGQDEREASLRAIKCGAADYITKPVDRDLIRLRVQSAISKSENERLRAQNGYLLLQSTEEAKYRTVLNSTGTVVIEYDWVNGVFTYDPLITKHIAGTYDDRRLWHVLMSDMVADAMDVMAMQERVHRVANDRASESSSMIVKLKTPSAGKQWFRMSVFKQRDDYQLTDKMIITFVNTNEEVLSDEKLRFQAERDSLTGLYNRTTFFEKVLEMISVRRNGTYIMACFDIDNFKVINDQYGSKKGDDVLIQVANVFRTGFEAIGGIICRIMADNFAVIYPIDQISPQRLKEIREAASLLDGTLPPIAFSIGRYVIDDLSLSVSAMYDRASLAKTSIKGRFDVNIASYDESMRERLLHEQEIVNEMKPALEGGQFEVWLQPQYNHATGAHIGAEALVRWRQPSGSIVSPDQFIPVFERNGFVYELDKYVWDKTCSMLRDWINEGRSPLPVSVNISRYDVFRDDFFQTITRLVRKYNLPVGLLRLEITESAFAKSTDQIISTVKQLIEYGFTLEIDDFGSGYSSLNTLKDVPAQIIKMDMRFLENSDNLDRSGNIMESVVRMAKWLNTSVIAEGVETKEQADYLQSIGCNYVQGYLYGKPMPRHQYEELAKLADKEENLLPLETVENLDNNTFWDPNSMDTLIFNTYVGGACIFEWHDGKIEMLRANDKYAKALGGENCTIDDILAISWEEHMDESAANTARDAIERTIQTGDDAVCEGEYFNLLGNGKTIYLRTTFRAIARTNDRYMLYATNENLTAQRAAEKKALETYEQMQTILTNINSGVTAMRMVGSKPEILFANDRYYSQMGYTKEQFEAELSSPYDLIVDDDKERVAQEMLRASEACPSLTIKYRVISREGRELWMQCNISVTTFPGISEHVLLTVTTDITSQVEAQYNERRMAEQLQAIMNNVSSGITAVITNGEDVEYIFTNDKFYAMYGYTREQYEAEVKNVFEIIHPDDRQRVLEAAERVNSTKKPVSLEYRVVCRDKKIIWVRNSISVAHFVGIGMPVQLGVSTDITAQKLAEETARIHEEGMRIAISQRGKMLCEYDPVTHILTVPEFYAKLYDLPAIIENIPDSVLDAGIITDDTADAYKAFYDAILRGEKKGSVQYRERRLDGSYHWECAEFSTMFDSEGKAAKTIIAVTETTKQHSQYELERKRPMMGEENLIGGGLFNLSNGAETLEYFRRGNLPVEPEDRVEVFGGGKKLTDLIINEREREQYRALHNVEWLLEQYKNGTTEHSIEYRRRLLNGDIAWVRNDLKLLLKPESNDILMFDYCYSIEDEKLPELLARSLIDLSYDFIIRINASKHSFVSMNNSKVSFAMPPERADEFDEVMTSLIEASVVQNERSDAMDNMLLSGIRRNLCENELYRFNYREIRPDGSIRNKKITQCYLDRERDIIILTREDIT